MQMKQIVVATDFSEQSDSAIRHGLHIARSAGAKLRFVHVVETPADDEGLESAHPAVQHWHADDAARLARDIEAYGANDIDISTEIVDAPSAAEGLQSIADAHGADLAIVGSTGLSGLKAALLGSTARKVLRTVQTHAMVARGDALSAAGYQRVLLPTDFSASAEKALHLAVALAAEVSCEMWKISWKIRLQL